jgi:hypothetical protein
MFEEYRTKLTFKEAVQIRSVGNEIQEDLANSRFIFNPPGMELICHFTASQPMKAGDFIVKQSPTDIYHVPKEVFMEKYELNTNDSWDLDSLQTENNSGFGWALAQLEAGFKVCRKGWNGKDMFLFLVPGSTFTVNRPPLLGIYPEGTEVNYHSHIDMKTASGEIVPWLASQTDMLAKDWQVLLEGE